MAPLVYGSIGKELPKPSAVVSWAIDWVGDNIMRIRWLLAITLLSAFILYEGCQPRPQTVAITVTAIPVPAVREVVLVQAQPAPPTPNLTDKLAARYYVINDARLYCSFITNELQYSGEPAMKTWWDRLPSAMKQWYFIDCQR